MLNSRSLSRFAVVPALACASAWGQPFATVDTSGGLGIGDARSSEARPFSRPVEAGASVAALEDAELGSRYGVTLGLDVVSAYYFRGIRQEDDGLIAQPYADLSVSAWEGESASVSLNFGVWNSVHGDTGTAGVSAGLPNYYEMDLYAGATVERGALSLQALYVAYASPSDAFDTVQEIDFSVSWDDSESPILGPVPLNPYATLAFELSSASADGGDRGGYLELGIAPSHSYGDDYAVSGMTLSLPLTLGLSLYDYYEDGSGSDDVFGFFDVGIDAAWAVPAGAGFGEIELTCGVHALFLGDNASGFNGGDEVEVVVSFGVSTSF